MPDMSLDDRRLASGDLACVMRTIAYLAKRVHSNDREDLVQEATLRVLKTVARGAQVASWAGLATAAFRSVRLHKATRRELAMEMDRFPSKAVAAEVDPNGCGGALEMRGFGGRRQRAVIQGVCDGNALGAIACQLALPLKEVARVSRSIIRRVKLQGSQ